MKKTALALALVSACLSPARSQGLAEAVARFEPVLCTAKNPALKGRTDFYDHKGALVHAAAGGAAEDAIAVLFEKKEPLFRAILARKCPANTLLDVKKLRELGQAYAISEFIEFDARGNRVILKNGLISEMRTYLYKGAGGLVRIGREKIVSFNATEVTTGDVNQGGVGGVAGQKEADSVGRLHTHPNSDNTEMVGVPAHRPSPQDVSQSNARGYYDVVVSPLYVFFINRKDAAPLVVDRKDPFGDNAVKAYLRKDAEALAYYDRNKKFPAWFDDAFNKKNNPWAR